MNRATGIPKDNSIIMGSIASIGARLTSVATMVLATGIAARVMTKEEFGLWIIFISIMFIAANFDLGFRFGLGNRLAAQVALSGGIPSLKHKELYLSIFYLQIAVSLIGIIVGFFLSQCISWEFVLKIHQPALIGNIKFLIFSVFGLILLNLPLSIVGSGFFAFQEVNLACYLSAAQVIIQLILFWISTRIFPFKGMLIIYFLTPLMTGSLFTAYFLKRRGWTMSWIPLHVMKRHIGSLARRSLEFFVLSLSSTIVASVSTILAGSVAGLSAAGDFDLVKKIFGLLVTGHLALLSPLAPAYTKAAQLGDWVWVKNKLRFCRYVLWPIIFIAAAGMIYIFHPMILKAWSGRNLRDYTLAGLLALVAVLSGWANTQSVLLNSLGLVKWQAAASIVMAPLCIFLPLYFGKFWNVTGIAFGTLICMIPGAFIWPIYASFALRKRLLRV